MSFSLQVVMSPLVVKRGHHGRYCFMLIGAGEKIGGEVHVEATESDKSDLRALALARIARLAEALLAGVTTRPVVDGDASAEDPKDLSIVDALDPGFHTSFGEGGQRGQV